MAVSSDEGCPAASPVLELRNVTQLYRTRGKEVLAVQDVSLSVLPGQTVALVGPSGCGKSTLLRIAAGLIAPTAGHVAVRGDHVQGVPLDLAMLPQDYGQALLPWRSVLGNVLLPFDAKRRRRANSTLSKWELRDRAQHIIERVGLEKFIHARPAELSGGMRQRVLLARALMTGAGLLLMDEPFSALDAMTRMSSQDLVRDVLRATEPSLSALLVTHDVDEAIYMSDRVVVLSSHPGRVSVEVPVGLPPDRDQVKTRASQRFLDLRAELLGHVQPPANGVSGLQDSSKDGAAA